MRDDDGTHPSSSSSRLVRMTSRRDGRRDVDMPRIRADSGWETAAPPQTALQQSAPSSTCTRGSSSLRPRRTSPDDIGVRTAAPPAPTAGPASSSSTDDSAVPHADGDSPVSRDARGGGCFLLRTPGGGRRDRRRQPVCAETFRGRLPSVRGIIFRRGKHARDGLRPGHLRHRGRFHPALVLYRRVSRRYLLVTFRDNAARSRVCSFADVLDVVPIRSRMIGGVQALPLLATLGATEREWLHVVYTHLVGRGGGGKGSRVEKRAREVILSTCPTSSSATS